MLCCKYCLPCVSYNELQVKKPTMSKKKNESCDEQQCLQPEKRKSTSRFTKFKKSTAEEKKISATRYTVKMGKKDNLNGEKRVVEKLVSSFLDKPVDSLELKKETNLKSARYRTPKDAYKSSSVKLFNDQPHDLIEHPLNKKIDTSKEKDLNLNKEPGLTLEKGTQSRDTFKMKEISKMSNSQLQPISCKVNTQLEYEGDLHAMNWDVNESNHPSIDTSPKFDSVGLARNTVESGYGSVPTSSTSVSRETEKFNVGRGSDGYGHVATSSMEVGVSNDDEEDLYSANTNSLPEMDDRYDSLGSQRINSVGRQRDIINYAKREWKSHTEKAQTMREGYRKVFDNGFGYIRRIRGDNYCAIRATLFQAMANGLPILDNWANTDQIVDELCQIENDWIQHWSFGGGRLGHANTMQLVKEKFSSCIKFLEEEYSSSKMQTRENREKYLLDLFNSPDEKDIILMEAAKILMLYNAMKLHRHYMKEQEVPTFVWLMFARDTSLNPRSLMLNHLNSVGSVGGLEQVEMYLLGHTLGLVIHVMRPLQHDQQDFISMYPNDFETNHSVTLIAEDDRHYNIVTRKKP